MKIIYYRDLDKTRSKARENYHKDVELSRQRQKNGRIKIRKEAFDQYGGSICVCCSEVIEVFLTIDHVNGGGNKQRKELNGGGHSLYRYLKKEGYPPGFQVMCMNCNFAKGRLGRCPHKQTLND